MTEPSFWNQFFIWPILNVLIAFYQGFSFFGLPSSFGLAIIALTLTVRLLLYPFTLSQLKSAKKMQELKPYLEALKDKHGHDREKLTRAQMELYKKHGLNPAAGCLPLILQMPIFIALYQVFWNLLKQTDLNLLTEQINKIAYFPFLKLETPPDVFFFGLNLAARPANWRAGEWWLILIPLITAFLMLLQSLMMVPSKTEKEEEKTERKEGGKTETMGEMGQVFQKQMTYLMPLMVGFFAFSFPVGLSLYWNTFTLFGISQQAFTTGWGSLAKYGHFLPKWR